MPVDNGQAAAAAPSMTTDRGAEAAQKLPPASEKDPIRELLDRMERLQPLLATSDPALARAIQAVMQHVADPARTAQAGFRTEVAYVLQDLEKSPVGRIDIAPALRADLNQLAATAVGLENPRMQALVASTAAISDRGLIRDIRDIGKEIGRQAVQTSPEVESRIDSLENRLRLTRRPEAIANAAHEAGVPPPPQQPQAEDRNSPPPRPESSAGATQSWATGQSPLNAILRGMRPADKGTGAPWDPPPTPFAQRATAFERRMQEGADQHMLVRAESAGRAALEAIRGFSAGEGATVMSRIREAARADPGGMAGVLSEMRAGGRFADLRQQFDNVLSDEKGATAAYDKAAAALARYGKDRPALEQAIARRPDAANLAAKFQQLDAQIGEAAGATPGRNDGTSMLDDLTKRAAEIVKHAVEAVKSVFARNPAADSSPGPGPGPSM
jgi:hypothetical protein